MRIDLNCDMGESYGRYELGNETAVMPFITSANIACGLHAGDPMVMQATIRLAKQHGVSIGVHPGWPDLQGFGRREMSLSAEEAEAFVIYQMGALAAFAKAEGVQLSHVKPHGALYNQAAKDRGLADGIARAVKRFDNTIILVGLAGSALIAAGLELGLEVANEGFPDRRYNSDGTLVSRKLTNAIMGAPEEVARHAVALARDGINFAGQTVRLDTLCLHGDNSQAAENAKVVREMLNKNGIEVQTMKR